MNGYTFKVGKTIQHFCETKAELYSILEKRGFVNYKKPEIGPENWADKGQEDLYPHWGLNGVFGKVVECEITTINENKIMKEFAKKISGKLQASDYRGLNSKQGVADLLKGYGYPLKDGELTDENWEEVYNILTPL